MRALALLLLTLPGCADDVCAGVDGTCIALTVQGSGEIDGLDIALAGGARGRQIAPLVSSVSSLPVHVALRIKNLTGPTVTAGVVGVRFGKIIGEGDVEIPVTAGQHTRATVLLDDPGDGGLHSLLDFSCPGGSSQCGGQCCSQNQVCSGDNSCLDCPLNSVPCNTICCPEGQSCVGGTCSNENQIAKVWVYLCPDFNQGCNATALSLDGMCSSLQGAQPGTCFLSEARVVPSHHYTLSACSSCPGNCSSGTGFDTPSNLPTGTYYPKIFFFCKTPCTPPGNCP